MSLSEDQKPSLEELLKDLEHPNPHINQEASLKMARYWPEESIKILIDNLNQSDLKVRRKSIKALANIGQKSLLPIADKFFSSNSEIVRLTCIKTFSRIAARLDFDGFPPEVIKVVEIAVEDDKPEMILSIGPLLRHMGKEGLPYLLRMCQDENVLRVQVSLMAIGELDEASIKKQLETILLQAPKDEFIRESIFKAIESIDD